MRNFPDYYIIDSSIQELVSLELIKSHLRINEDKEDNLLRLFLKSAIEYAEGFTGLSITQRTIEANFYNFQNDILHLPRIPAISVENVSLINYLGKKQKLKKDQYHFDDRKLYLEKSEIASYNLKVIYKAGYDSTTVPAMLVEALLVHIGVMYESRVGEIAPPLRSLNTYLKFKKGRL